MPKTAKTIVILGTTASGKTPLAIALAKKYRGEIICVDSRTIYKGMDIGTAKPSISGQREVRHHLLDIVDPNISFSVVEFKTLCLKTMAEISKRGNIPILVGGSGMYIDAILYDYQFRKAQSNLDITNLSTMQKVEMAEKLYPRDMLRIGTKNIRRIDQLLLLGPANVDDRESIKIDCKIIGLKVKPPLLKQNIAIRTSQMLDNRFIQEVESIRNNYGLDCKALATIGYQQVGNYLDNKISKQELSRNINKATSDLAKKQLTWFKRNKHIIWVENFSEADKVCSEYLNVI
ncbi:tRNA (adenosine(37)-N6)-dimethylallyltransferase MiaA [Candidatus Saccharibacteria bacterium]|nr:tRNA (adenosine(37)-N6)-dimethylallyltransferase MiaA [Candidatus Saccharibacteria bacterium]